MSLINTTTGLENLADANCKVYIFHVPHGAARGGTEDHLYSVAEADKMESNPRIKKNGAPIIKEALRSPDVSRKSRWNTQIYDVRDGEVLKIFASRSSGFGFPVKTAALFVRARGEGPLWRVRVKTLNRVETTMPHVDISGRFDIMQMADITALGVSVPPMFIAQLMPIVQNELFETTMLEPAIVGRDVVVRNEVKVGDQTVVLATSERRRHFDF